ncbi:MAG: tripartite tricarboxylate transporter substrate-binding protein [Proteobacteria bacterium]|nr:tripartite tricarboxylate transporter substrate-binding protein [Pseudomonadota bacterium]
MYLLTRLTAVSAAVALSSGFLTTAGAADEVADFYKGKTLRVIVASSAGGGYDAYSRVLARHIVKFIPGHPSAVVQNMPGAGGLRAANFLYNKASKDGSYIGHVQRTAPFHQILGYPGAQFDPTKFNWLGSLNNEVSICVVRKGTKVKTFEDLRKYQALVGGAGPAADSETIPTFLNNMLGTKFKVISGYPGSTETALAIDRKEVDGICGSYSSITSAQKRWFKKGNEYVNILVQASTRKHPEIPLVPLASDLARSDLDRAVMELNDARLEMGRPFLTPPGVPKARVKALRVAFVNMTKDAEFAAHIRRLGRELNPVSGADIQALIERVVKADATVVAKLKDALIYRGKKGKVVIQMISHTGKVSGIKKEGRTIMIMYKGKEVAAKVSGSKTKVTLNGKKVKRKIITAGMTCTFIYPNPGSTAQNVDCKS